MSEFRRNESKIADETVYSSDNENDGYLSESDNSDGNERDESFPEEDVERFTAGSPANFLPSRKPIERMIDKKRSQESNESDSVSAGKK